MPSPIRASQNKLQGHVTLDIKGQEYLDSIGP